MSSEKPATAAAPAEIKQRELGRVLVIGGNGFLGHHVVDQLLDEPVWGVSHLAVVDLRCTRNRRPESDGVAYHETDISDADAVLSVFEEVKPDVVIHTASPAPHAAGAEPDNDLYERVNVGGAKAIVAACQAVGVTALVFTSSASVISDNSSNLINADERWPVIRGEAQSEYYSETKAHAEQIILQANRAESHPNLFTAAIRPSGIFGEGDSMLLPGLVRIYRQGRTAFQIGDGENLFDFTYVGNVAHAHILAARLLLVTSKSKTLPLDFERVDGEAFLITNDSPMYFWDFSRAVFRAAGSEKGTDHVWSIPKEIGLAMGFCSEVVCHIMGKTPTFTRQRCAYSCMTRYFNIIKAKRVLGYRPIVGLDEGIKRGVQWILDQEKAGLIEPVK